MKVVEANKRPGIPISTKEQPKDVFHLKYLATTFPDHSDWIKRTHHLKLDASWKPVPGYCYIDIHAVMHNCSRVIGVILCPSETADAYVELYDHIRSHLPEEVWPTFDALPILCDQGSAIRSAFNPISGKRPRTLFFCHFHILRNEGIKTLGAKFVNRLLKASYDNLKLSQEIELIKIELRKLSEIDFKPSDRLIAMLNNTTPEGSLNYFTPESWRLDARLEHPPCGMSISAVNVIMFFLPA